MNAWTSRLRTTRPAPRQARVLTPAWHLGLPPTTTSITTTWVCSGPRTRWPAHRYRAHRQQYDRGMGDRLVAHRYVAAMTAVSSSWLTPPRTRRRYWCRAARRRCCVLLLRPGSTPWSPPFEMITWKTSDGEKRHGFCYAPVNPDFEAPRASCPRSLSACGRPDQRGADLNSAFPAWTSRGFMSWT